MAELRYIPREQDEGEAEADTRYKQQRAENERLKAVEREIKLAKARGDLIERAACLKQASYVMTTIRQRLMLVPTVAARKLKGDQHAAKLIIAAEIRSALEELANFPEKVTAVVRTRK